MNSDYITKQTFLKNAWDTLKERLPEHHAAPAPATHANLSQLKSGETVYQADELHTTL